MWLQLKINEKRQNRDRRDDRGGRDGRGDRGGGRGSSKNNKPASTPRNDNPARRVDAAQRDAALDERGRKRQRERRASNHHSPVTKKKARFTCAGPAEVLNVRMRRALF